jgi:hypothetical protein
MVDEAPRFSSSSPTRRSNQSAGAITTAGRRTNHVLARNCRARPRHGFHSL